jgi:pheromone alpha factor receptor
MACLLTIAIQISLVLQVKIVCCNLETWKRRTIMIFSGLTAFTASGIRFALMVINIDWNIVNVATVTQSQFDALSSFASASNITFVVSICISAIIFCSKLFFAIRLRHSLGMKQFGSMQIIFVMGCQTMISPCKFFHVRFDPS